MPIVPLLWRTLSQLWIEPHYSVFPVCFRGARLSCVASRVQEIPSLEPGCRRVSAGLLAGIVAAAGCRRAAHFFLAVRRCLVICSPRHRLRRGRPSLDCQAASRVAVSLAADQSAVGHGPFARSGIATALPRSGRVPCWTNSVFFIPLTGTWWISARGAAVRRSSVPGINSLFSVLACTLFYVFFTRPPVSRHILNCRGRL